MPFLWLHVDNENFVLQFQPVTLKDYKANKLEIALKYKNINSYTT